MAAGFDKNARVWKPLLATGFGFVEVGTLTPKPQSGNPSARIFRSAADGAIINRLGFNNEGQEAALPRLAGRRQGIVGVNIGAGRDSQDRIGDYVMGLKRMSPVADYLTINISSPNTPGLRDLQAPDALNALLDACSGGAPCRAEIAAAPRQARPRHRRRRPTGNYQRSSRRMASTASWCRTQTLARDGLNDRSFAEQSGGLSGRPLFARSTHMLAKIYRLTEGKLPLVGVGGINAGAAALAENEAGASLFSSIPGWCSKDRS